VDDGPQPLRIGQEFVEQDADDGLVEDVHRHALLAAERRAPVLSTQTIISGPVAAEHGHRPAAFAAPEDPGQEVLRRGTSRGLLAVTPGIVALGLFFPRANLAPEGIVNDTEIRQVDRHRRLGAALPALGPAALGHRHRLPVD